MIPAALRRELGLQPGAEVPQNAPGAETMARLLPGAVVSVVDCSEVVAKLADYGVPADQARGLPCRPPRSASSKSAEAAAA